jgi:hypothetical protein
MSPSIQSRRAMLAGSGALLTGVTAFLAVLVSQAAGPDAELIQLCSQIDVLEHARLATFTGGAAPMVQCSPEHDALLDGVANQQEVLADRIAEILPQTLEGFRAVARSIVLWAPDMANDSFGELGGLHGVLNSALLRGLIGEARL